MEMTCPSLEGLIIIFITFLTLSPCSIYLMTAADDNGSIIRNLFYLGLNLTIVSTISWVINKKFQEEPLSTFNRKRIKSHLNRQHSLNSSKQGDGAKDAGMNSSDSTSRRRFYPRKKKGFRKGKMAKLPYRMGKRPCLDSLLVGYLGTVMGLFATCATIPVMVEVLENSDGYSDNLPLVICLELLSFISALSLTVYKSYKELEFYNAELVAATFQATFQATFRELLECYEHDGISVSMKDPRDCSYHKYFNRRYPTKIEKLGETIRAEKAAPNGWWYRFMPVEMRGITLRQLRAVYANAKRRCVEEKWVDWKGQLITPENVNLYHINDYIIKPFTEITQRSFVESLPSTAGTQPPRWFVSHWWGEPFSHTLDCIDTFLRDFRANYNDRTDTRGGGMTEDTPLWICAFANNQWGLDVDMATDPKKSSFTKAMEVACFRTISILDAKGTVFTRIWCVFELLLTLILDKKVAGLWVVYTACRHRYVYKRWDVGQDRVAVGIIPGGAPGELHHQTCAREKHFPFKVILDSLNRINILSAQASVPADKTRIMNSVVECDDIDATPPTTHEKYDKLNDSVKASFVYSFAVLNAAHNDERGDVWESTMTILSKGTMTGTFKLGFDSFSPRLSSSEARDLVTHVPITCAGLSIWHAYGNGEGVSDGLVEWLLEKKEANSLAHLQCYNCKVGDEERGRVAGSRLAAALASNHAQSMEKLSISRTDWINSGNVSEWKSALKEMTNLKEWFFSGSDLSEEEIDILKNATHAKVRID